MSGPAAFQACTTFTVNRIVFPVWFIRSVMQAQSASLRGLHPSKFPQPETQTAQEDEGQRAWP
jgi:hypothetical protein